MGMEEMRETERGWKILMRSLNSRESKKETDENERIHYNKVEFHMVDILAETLTTNYLPSLWSCMGFGSMVQLGPLGGSQPPDVYVLGGARHPFEMSDTVVLHMDDPGYYSGAVRSEACGYGWDHIKLPNRNRYSFPGCAAMMGRVYCFGCNKLKPEVYDSESGKWENICTSSLPLEVLGDKVSWPVVPDYDNKRILLHLSGRFLYAFYPGVDGEGDKWECLSKEFFRWFEVADVVDNVLYFHDFNFPSVLQAYDLLSRNWLPVVWSSFQLPFNDETKTEQTQTDEDEDGDDDDEDVIDVRDLSFSYVFSPKKGMLCLAHRGLGRYECPVTFFIISVQRTRRSRLKLTPLSYKSYILPSIEMVIDFVPL